MTVDLSQALTPFLTSPQDPSKAMEAFEQALQQVTPEQLFTQLGKSKSTQAAEWLQAYLQAPDVPKEHAKLARKALFHLTGSRPMQATTPSPAKDVSQWPVFESWATVVDGWGSQGFFIARERPAGDLAFLSAVYNNERGIVDGYAEERTSKRHFRQVVTLSSKQSPATPLPPDRLVTYLAKARSEGKTIHPDVKSHLDLLEGLAPGPPPAERATGWARPERVHETASLLRSRWFAGQWLLSDEGPDAVDLEAFRSDPSPLTERIDRHLEAVFLPAKRASYADRLYRMADWLDAMGEAELRDLSATAAWALEQGQVRDHPLLRAMLAEAAGELEIDPESVSWPIVEAELGSAISWRAAGVAILWLRREAPDGRSVAITALLNLLHGGIELAVADTDPDKVRGLRDMVRKAARERRSRFTAIAPEQLGRIFAFAYEFGKEIYEAEPDRRIEALCRLLPQLSGEPSDWERLDPALLSVLRKYGPLTKDVPEGKEPMVLTTLRLRAEQPDALRSVLEQDRAFDEVAPGSWQWTRKYPRGHISPFAKEKGARQIIGSVRWDGDTVDLEAKTISMAAALWDRLDDMAPGSLSWLGGEWLGLEELRGT